MARGIKDKRVLDVMGKVPRHKFVDKAFWDRAYGDHALPIGDAQTISQPYMVALMTEILKVKGDERVLEIGTGSGYQTAILAELTEKVFSIERIKSLAMRARNTLEEMRVQNVVIKLFDGTYGWIDEGPFDAIIIPAAAPEIPKPFIDQLKEGGRMAVPIGDRTSQILYCVEKRQGKLVKTSFGACVFVPLIGQYAWQESKEN